MKTKSTFCNLRKSSKFPLYSFISRCFVLALLLVGGFALEGRAQTPANTVTLESHVTSAANATAINENVASVNARAGSLLSV